VLFQTKAKELSADAGRNPVTVYRLKIDFRQLPIDPAAVEQMNQQHILPQWLLWAPRSDALIIRRDGKSYITGTTALRLVETLLLYCYADIYPDAAEFNAYLRREYERYQGLIGEFVEVEVNPRMQRSAKPKRELVSA
jgi:hypothetical protein